MEVEFPPANAGAAGGGRSAAAAAAPREQSNTVQLLGVIVRAMALLLTFLATVVMGAAKQTVAVDLFYFTFLERISGTIKMSYSSAFVYFTVANAIVFAYTLLSLVASLASRANPGSVELLVGVGDLVTLALLFSGNGAAAAIAVVAENGQNNLGWPKFCSLTGKFCSEFKAAIVLSMFAAALYLLLALLAIVGRRR